MEYERKRGRNRLPDSEIMRRLISRGYYPRDKTDVKLIFGALQAEQLPGIFLQYGAVVAPRTFRKAHGLRLTRDIRFELSGLPESPAGITSETHLDSRTVGLRRWFSSVDVIL